MPRAAQAARTPTAMAVLPCPDDGALTTRRGCAVMTVEPPAVRSPGGTQSRPPGALVSKVELARLAPPGRGSSLGRAESAPDPAPYPALAPAFLSAGSLGSC